MSKLTKLFSLAVAIAFVSGGIPYAAADTVDQTLTITVTTTTITGYANWTANLRDVATGNLSSPQSLSFSSVTAATWTVADQYVHVLPSSNYALWGVIVSSDNNNAASSYFGMAAKLLARGPSNLWGNADNSVSYGGLIDATTMNNPNNRATLAWAVYEDRETTLPTINDSSLYGKVASGGSMVPSASADPWNADWAAVVDVSNRTTGSASGVTGTAVSVELDPDNDTNTVTYSTIIQGGGANAGMNYHPPVYSGTTLQGKPIDADGSAVYLAARFGGLSAGAFGVYNLRVQMVHE